MEHHISKPLYIKIKEIDNVAIVVNDNGLPKGTVFSDGLELIENVPQGHKVALNDIDLGQEIIRYGEVIGYAKVDIKKGGWINESVTQMPTAPELHELAIATKKVAPLPPL